MNGRITEPTLTRMEDKLGRPIRRGLDKAMNEVMDLSETQETAADAETAAEKIDCLNGNCKKELEDVS